MGSGTGMDIEDERIPMIIAESIQYLPDSVPPAVRTHQIKDMIPKLECNNKSISRRNGKELKWSYDFEELADQLRSKLEVDAEEWGRT